ncbi:MAG: VanZ family protein [Phycisphaerales bacterium]|nr:VanZ family protein [Phycisphaerales bacterium]
MLRSGWIGFLTCLYTGLLVYASSIPFDFSSSAAADGIPTFLGIPIVELRIPDAMSNLALYLPFGMLCRAWMQRRGAGGLGAAVGTVLAAAGISFAVESCQDYSLTRVASVADLFCNVLGAFMGVLWLTPERFLYRKTVATAAGEIERDAAGVLLAGWAIVTALVALAPLDLTIDVSHVAGALRHAHFIPLEKHAGMVEQARWNIAPVVAAAAAVDLWQLRLDYVADVAVFAVTGALAAHWSRRGGHTNTRAAIQAMLIGVAIGVVTTCAELFVMSVGFDGTRIVTRSLGAMVGGCVFGMVRFDARRVTPWRLAALACGVYIVARAWAPFCLDRVFWKTGGSAIEWLPLHAYSLGKLPQAAADGLHKSARFLLLGFLLAGGWLTLGVVVTRRRRIATGCVVAIAATLLELVQQLIPGRYPAITDVILASLMTPVGIVVAQRLHRFVDRRREADESHSLAAMFNAPIPPPDSATAVSRQRGVAGGRAEMNQIRN